MWLERAIGVGDLNANWSIARRYFRQRRDIAKTVQHSQRIVVARRGIPVSDSGVDTPTRYLRWFERDNTAA
jgi:hypothetical protein